MKSKRTIKNIIMLFLIIMLIIANVFTMYYAKNNNTIINNNMMQSNMPTQDNQNKETPPEIPSGESNDIEDDTSLEKNDTDLNEETPPSMPSDDSGQDGALPVGMDAATSATLDTKYYVFFGVENLLISLLLIYLFMSRFNKKSFKETLNGDKVTIYVLCLIILTTCLTIGSGYITKNYVSNKSNNIQTPEESSGSNATYQAAKEITEDEEITSGTFSSDEVDQNAILVSGDIKATLSNITVTKTGDSNGGDNTSFYGTNSAIIAKDKANLTLKNITVTTNATGANGVFSYGGSATTNNSSSDGTTINISDSKITTTKDNSGGIMATGGGIINATNLTINTAGISSAAIRTDRGGGTVTVDKGTYTTTGAGSPTIYSTADVTVKNATLIAKASEGIVIEGSNSVEIDNCDLTDSNTKLNGQSTTYKNIFLYQSMSGDASSGNAIFTAKNSNIITNNGDSFYVTNTIATINLENNTITNNDSDGNFLRVQKDSWGNNGSNGGDVTLVMTNQTVTGNIVIDSISTLDMTMKKGSYYEGIINGSNSAKSIKLTLEKDAKIKLTGDSYVTSLDDADSSYSNIDFNGYTLYVDGKAIN